MDGESTSDKQEDADKFRVILNDKKKKMKFY